MTTTQLRSELTDLAEAAVPSYAAVDLAERVLAERAPTARRRRFQVATAGLAVAATVAAVLVWSPWSTGRDSSLLPAQLPEHSAPRWPGPVRLGLPSLPTAPGQTAADTTWWVDARGRAAHLPGDPAASTQQLSTLSPDGTWVMTARQDDTAVLRSLGGRTTRVQTLPQSDHSLPQPSDPYPYPAAVGPRGEQVAVVVLGPDDVADPRLVVTAGPDGGATKAIELGPGGLTVVGRPRWDGDGAHVLLQNDPGGLLVDVTTGRVSQIRCPDASDAVDIGPDGILCSSYGYAAWLVDPTGTAPPRLLRGVRTPIGLLPDHQVLTVVTKKGTFPSPYRLAVVDTRSGKTLDTLDVLPAERPVTAPYAG